MINSGFILINKSKNISSQKLDLTLKKKYNINKIGHLGTLDPLAEGLLVIGINSATKYFKYFENLNKKYILRIRIGSTSQSLDYEKELTNIVDVDLRGREKEIDNLLLSFKKKYKQYPPIYSAIKVDGKKMYEYARSNKDLQIDARDVEIYDIKRVSDIEYINGNSFFDIELFVSKGFYVRSFSKEFGDILGYPSMSDNIKRTKVGPFELSNSVTLDDDNITLLNPMDYLDFKIIDIDELRLKYILNGANYIHKYVDDLVLLKYMNENIAIYKYDYKNKDYRLDLLIKNENSRL